MIELNKKTQQDFLDRKWVQKLMDAGIDMSDAKYSLVILDNKEWVTTKEALESKRIIAHFVSADTPRVLPTYSISELYEQCLFKRNKEDLYKDLLCEDCDRPLIVALAEEYIRYVRDD